MGKITINELHKSLFDYVQTVSDNKLETNNKTIVGAINELFSDNSNDIEINNLKNEISNGKKLIADAIGEPLTEEDTFSAMSTDINGLLSTFKTNMMNAGTVVESSDKFKQLIDKIKGLTEGEGNKGVQYVEGTIESAESSTYVFTTVDGNLKSKNYAIIPNLPFEPIILILDVYDNISGRTWISILSYDSSLSMNTVKVGSFSENSETVSSYHFKADDAILTNNYIRMPIWGNKDELTFKYCAIGVGEEDTTLRDSLASVLEDEGVNVTEEDDMASLITKTDNEFQENTTILYNKMKDANYNVDSSMNMDALLNELTFKTIIEGKVTQSPSTSENSLVYSVSGLDFTPSLVYVTLGGVYEQSDEIESVYYKSIILNNRQSFVGASEYNTIKVNIKNNGFNLILNSQDGGTYTGLGWTSINGISYVAIR